jgi:hypothetical protein
MMSSQRSLLGSHSVKLPSGVGVDNIADWCCTALEGYLSLSSVDEVGQWFESSYQRAAGQSDRASLVPPSGRMVSSRSIPPRSLAPAASLSPEQSLRADQQRVRALIRLARGSDSGAFVAALPSTVSVVRVHDAFGGKGVGPTDAPGLTMLARAISLLVAHYLTSPEQFVAPRDERLSV